MLLVLFAPFALRADEIIVGNGTDSANIGPFGNAYGYSWVEMVYPSSMIGQACTITSLSYNCTTVGQTFTSNEINVYLAESTKTTMTSGSFTPEADLTLVYTGTNVTIGDAEWETLVLDTPFEYSGENSLVVVFSNNGGGLSNLFLKWACSTSSNSIMFDFSDSDPIGAQFPSSGCQMGGNGYAYNKLPNMKLNAGGTTPDPEEPEQPEEPEVAQYRIKANTTGKYLNVFNNIKHDGGAYGGVGVALLDEESSAQIFTMEDAGNGNFYLSADGYYVKCWAWNVDAYSTTDKTALSLVEAGNDTYYIKNMANSKYFKVENVYSSEVGYQYFIFCDCTGSCQETWTLEPVTSEEPDPTPDPEPDPDPTPDPEVTVLFSDDFNDGELTGWRTFQSDNDTHNWKISTSGMDGSKCIISESYLGGDLDPDNYIVTTSQYSLSESSEFTFYVRPRSQTYIFDRIGVVVSEDDQNWTVVWNELFDENSTTTYVQRTIDLSEYAGKNIYVGFRHYDCEVGFSDGVLVDNVELTGGGSTEPIEPTVPAAPANLAATANGQTTISLTWDAVENATSYNVYSGEYEVVAGLTETTYTIENLTAGTEYCYNVTAVNEAGESEASAEDCATTESAGGEDPEGNELVIGNGTESTSVAPFRNSYQHSWVEMIYPASEIESGAITINSIAYNCANVGTASMELTNVYIYMGETSRTSIGAPNDWTPQEDLTLVYTGNNITIGEEEWETFVLDTPFDYSGTQNLVIAVGKNSAQYNNSIKWAYLPTDENSIMHTSSDYNDSFSSYPANSGTMGYQRPNVKLGYTANGNPEPEVAEGDIWEDAIEVAELPFTHTPDFANLNNDYTLPGEEQDGKDVVYKLTLAEETTIAATVNGANGKVAVYAEDFNGEDGPGADNYYGANETPDNPDSTTGFFFDFNDGSLEGWETLDADGDTYNWGISNGVTQVGSDGTTCLFSLSTSLQPNNYVYTSEAYAISEDSELTFEAKANSMYYPDYYSVVISEDGEFFLTIWEEQAPTSYTTNTVDLSNYAGKNLYIGFHHYNSNYCSGVLIDNVKLTGSATDPVDPTPDPEEGATAFSDDFNDVNLDGWRVFENDGDGNNWGISDGITFGGINGTGCIYSETYLFIGGAELYPDNYIVTTSQYEITEGSTFTWNVFAQDPYYSADHYAFVVSSDNENWTIVWEETLESSDDYMNRSVDMSEYAGQSLYLGFRHYDCNGTEATAMSIDDVALTNGTTEPDPTPDPEEGETAFLFDFNGEDTFEGLTLIDADGDGYNFEAEPAGYGGTYVGYNNTRAIMSYSWSYNYGTLTPDNYIVTEQAYPITANSVVSLNVKSATTYDYAEHYGVVVSEDGQNWTTVFEETLTSNEWINPTVSLSAYAGKNLYIGVRHFDCTYIMYLMVDNFQLSTSAKRNNRANSIEETLPAGTYYLVASATEAFSVNINTVGEQVDPELPSVAQVTATENGANVDVEWSMESAKFATHINPETGKAEYLNNTINTRDASEYTFHSYKLYRANGDNEPIVLAENLAETTYEDATWAEAESGVYKWGVAAMYTANAKNRETTTILNEGFETEYYVLPEGWTTYSDPATANTNGNWNTMSAIGIYSACTGSYSAYSVGYVSQGSNYYLVSPALDFTSAINGTLSFNYISPGWQGSSSTIAVSYSESATGPWTELWKYEGADQSTWAEAETDLSALSGKVVYLAFISTDNMGFGAGVDNVLISAEMTDGPVPVASEIVWSNAIDKDMTTTVDVTVTAADGASVAGTLVSLVNVNEPAYAYEVTLDETGYYEWTEFRKGTYEYTVSLEGYISCATEEIIEITDATSLECTLELKPELVDGLYVSPTGWAMWEYVAPEFTGETFSFDFEDATMMGWTNIDADGDGNKWFSNVGSEGAIVGNNESTYCVVSQSYDNAVGPLTPNNYLVSPEKYAIVNGSTFSFYVAAQDANYAAEHYGVAISTTGNTSASDFTTIWEETLTAKTNGQKGPRDGSRANGTWYHKEVDLSAYAGQEVYIALRHFACTDMFYIIADDFTLGGKTSADIFDVVFEGETVANDIEESFYQLDVTGLTDGQEYTTSVIPNNATDQVLEYTWTYRDCSNFAGVANLAATVENGNATITWDLPVQDNSQPVYEFSSNFDNGSLAGWTNVDANGDGHIWQNTSEFANQGFGVNNTYCAASMSYDNMYGAIMPDNYLVTDQKYTITEGSKLTFSISAHDRTYDEEHYGVAISTTGTNATDFTVIFEETLSAGEAEYEGSLQGQWYNMEIDLSAYAGQQVYIAFRHFNCYNMAWLKLDDVELTSSRGSKDGQWLQYHNGINELALGLTNEIGGPGLPINWAIMFPADAISGYAGTYITKVSTYVYEGHEGGFSIHFGGDNAPGTAVHTQSYDLSSYSYQTVEIELTNPVQISGTENVWIQFSNTTGMYVASYTVDCGDANARWFSDNGGSTWYDAAYFGEGWYGSWQISAYVDGDATPLPDEPEVVDTEVLGAMIYRDGELLTTEPLNAETYTDNGLATGEHTYEVRVVYGGETADTYYAMSCADEVTTVVPLDCVAPEKLYGEFTYNSASSFGATLRWPYNGSVSDWLYYDDGINMDGIGGPQSFYWGIKLPAESLESYAGTFMTKVAMYDYAQATSTLQIYYGGENAPETLVHTQECVGTGSGTFVEYDLTASLPIDPTTNIWVVMYTTQGTSYPASCCVNTGDPNGRWISMDGASWMDVLTGAGLDVTWMIRAYVSNAAKGEVSELKPLERTENNVVADDAKFVAANGAKGNAFDHYNIYRGTSNDNYELIAESNSGYYFDELNESGTFYYQVTAVYAENGLECESDPATAYDNESQNYVVVTVDAIDENGVNGMMVYPNPTKDNVNIFAENMTRITITNTLGQVMLDQAVNSDNEIINMAQYEAGVYTVRITTENGVAVKRITVVK